jgi:hypothetical protein
MGMGTINFAIFHIIFIDHVMYILAKNKAGKDVVVGMDYILVVIFYL